MENQTKTKLTLNPEEEKQSNILLGRSCEADSSTYCTDTD